MASVPQKRAAKPTLWQNGRASGEGSVWDQAGKQAASCTAKTAALDDTTIPRFKYRQTVDEDGYEDDDTFDVLVGDQVIGTIRSRRSGDPFGGARSATMWSGGGSSMHNDRASAARAVWNHYRQTHTSAIPDSFPKTPRGAARWTREGESYRHPGGHVYSLLITKVAVVTLCVLVGI
jgi:hypothetical protein